MYKIKTSIPFLDRSFEYENQLKQQLEWVTYALILKLINSFNLNNRKKILLDLDLIINNNTEWNHWKDGVPPYKKSKNNSSSVNSTDFIDNVFDYLIDYELKSRLDKKLDSGTLKLARIVNSRIPKNLRKSFLDQLLELIMIKESTVKLSEKDISSKLKSSKSGRITFGFSHQGRYSYYKKKKKELKKLNWNWKIKIQDAENYLKSIESNEQYLVNFSKNNLKFYFKEDVVNTLKFTRNEVKSKRLDKNKMFTLFLRTLSNSAPVQSYFKRPIHQLKNRIRNRWLLESEPIGDAWLSPNSAKDFHEKLMKHLQRECELDLICILINKGSASKDRFDYILAFLFSELQAFLYTRTLKESFPNSYNELTQESAKEQLLTYIEELNIFDVLKIRNSRITVLNQLEKIMLFAVELLINPDESNSVKEMILTKAKASWQENTEYEVIRHVVRELMDFPNSSEIICNLNFISEESISRAIQLCNMFFDTKRTWTVLLPFVDEHVAINTSEIVEISRSIDFIDMKTANDLIALKLAGVPTLFSNKTWLRLQHIQAQNGEQAKNIGYNKAHQVINLCLHNQINYGENFDPAFVGWGVALSEKNDKMMVMGNIIGKREQFNTWRIPDLQTNEVKDLIDEISRKSVLKKEIVERYLTGVSWLQRAKKSLMPAERFSFAWIALESTLGEYGIDKTNLISKTIPYRTSLFFHGIKKSDIPDIPITYRFSRMWVQEDIQDYFQLRNVILHEGTRDSLGFEKCIERLEHIVATVLGNICFYIVVSDLTNLEQIMSYVEYICKETDIIPESLQENIDESYQELLFSKSD